MQTDRAPPVFLGRSGSGWGSKLGSLAGAELHSTTLQEGAVTNKRNSTIHNDRDYSKTLEVNAWPSNHARGVMYRYGFSPCSARAWDPFPIEVGRYLRANCLKTRTRTMDQLRIAGKGARERAKWGTSSERHRCHRASNSDPFHNNKTCFGMHSRTAHSLPLELPPPPSTVLLLSNEIESELYYFSCLPLPSSVVVVVNWQAQVVDLVRCLLLNAFVV